MDEQERPRLDGGQRRERARWLLSRVAALDATDRFYVLGYLSEVAPDELEMSLASLSEFEGSAAARHRHPAGAALRVVVPPPQRTEP